MKENGRSEIPSTFLHFRDIEVSQKAEVMCHQKTFECNSSDQMKSRNIGLFNYKRAI
jgi:hypothetical protein